MTTETVHTPPGPIVRLGFDDKARDAAHAKYDALGGARYGAIATEYDVPGGYYIDCSNRAVVYSLRYGAFEVHGQIYALWHQLGGITGFLGFPETDESGCPDGVGRYNHFAGGSIYWTPATGAHEVHGAIRDRWSQLGWERSRLGYPITDERNNVDNRGGRVSRFQHGFISWTPSTGAHEHLTGALYQFALDSFRITNTRSRHTDTDKVGVTLRVGTGAVVTSDIKAMGDLNNGDFTVGNQLAPQQVDDPDVYAFFGVNVVNAGNNQTDAALRSAFDDLATKGAQAGLAALGGVAAGPAGTAVATGMDALVKILITDVGSLIFPDCDGPVLIDQFCFSGATLNDMTHGRSDSTFTQTKHYTGIDSDHGCGANSEYDGTWRVTQIG